MKFSSLLKPFFAGLFVLISFFSQTQQIFAAPPSGFQTSLVVGSGIQSGVSIEFAPDGRLFILQRTGEVKVWDGNQLHDFAFLPSAASGDRGLIGIAFDPNFLINKYVYLYYTGLPENNTTNQPFYNYLIRMDATTNTGQGQLRIFSTDYTGISSQELHVGGGMAFGLDGKIYLGVGDNGNSTNGQNLAVPFGKIIRINSDGSIPNDNPWYSTPGADPRIWAMGVRNPWRLNIDKETGLVFVGDVGNAAWEEINQITKGANFGWPLHEGVCLADCTGISNPLYYYPHVVNGVSSSAAVTGGPVYRSQMFPAEYQGNLFFADYARGFIKRAQLDYHQHADGDIEAHLQQVSDFDLNAGSVVDLEIAQDGSIYYITYFPAKIYRITYNTGNQIPIANASSNITKGIEPLTVNFSSTGSYDPEGQPLNYLWDFGDGNTSTQPNPTYTYTNPGTYIVELTVSDGTYSGLAIPIVIQVGIPPSINLAAPTPDTMYQAGDTIFYSASGIDGAGFDLDDNAFTTEVIFHHDTHTHPFLGPLPATKSGTFTIPLAGEPDPDTWFEIIITATDSHGLSTTKNVEIFPHKSSMTINTQPAGLQVLIDGIPTNTPYSEQAVLNYHYELSANPQQTFNNLGYQFVGWSDNASPTRTVIIQNNPNQNNYTALFNQLNPFTGEYFNNMNLQGEPVLTREDGLIDFDWGLQSPGPGVNQDFFSVRWSSQQQFQPGTYKFTTTSDDGVRVYVNNQLIIDKWIDQGSTSWNGEITINQAGTYPVILEFYDNYYAAVAKMSWELIAPIQNPDSYSAKYWNYTNSAATPQIPVTSPIFTNSITNIDFDWNNLSPDSTITNDYFLAQWTKQHNFEESTYQFTVTADDGIRVYIDNTLILDEWHDQAPTTYQINHAMTQGIHEIKIEYFERTGGATAKVTFTPTSATPTPTPTATPTPSAQTWNAQYWNVSQIPSVSNLPTTTANFTRTENDINHNWGDASPDASIQNDNFVANWQSTQTLTSGVYKITTVTDDGILVKINDDPIIYEWNDHGPFTNTAYVPLQAGNHQFDVTYYEKGGGATAQLSIQRVGEYTMDVPYVVSFWNTPYSTRGYQIPTAVQESPTAIADWHTNAPAPNVNPDGFQANWYKKQYLPAGRYRLSYYTLSGGGDTFSVRVDNTQISQNTASSIQTFDIQLSAGVHTFDHWFTDVNGNSAAFNFTYELIPEAVTTLTANPACTVSSIPQTFDIQYSGTNLIYPQNFDTYQAYIQIIDTQTNKTGYHAAGILPSTFSGNTNVSFANYAPGSSGTGAFTLIGDGRTYTMNIIAFVPGNNTPQILSPSVTFRPNCTSTTDWSAQYWNFSPGTPQPVIPNTAPLYTQSETEINHLWGAESPNAAITNDNFLGQWTKDIYFSDGNYEFSVTADDGVRVYLDNQIIIDQWIDQAPTTYKNTQNIVSGTHSLKIEYYERGGGATVQFSYEQVGIFIPTPTPTPTNMPNFFIGKYWNNTNPNATPQIPTNTPAYTLNTSSINYNWEQGSPDASIYYDNFVAQWVQTTDFTAGQYQFTTTSDDGVRVFVDDQPVINQWSDQAPTTHTGLTNINAGTHTIRIEYYERGGGALMQFNYERIGDISPINTSDKWNAEFWNLPSLNPSPSFPTTPANATRLDTNITFNWGQNSPEIGIDPDKFLARWTKNVVFENGTYQFTTQSDDGVRVYVNGNLIIDQWNDHGNTTHTGNITLAAGTYPVVVEYYENMWDAIISLVFSKQ